MQTVDTVARQPETRGGAATKPAAPSVSGASVKIDLKSIKLTPKPPAKRYWVGVRLDAPFDQVSVNGIGFSKFHGKTPVDDAGRIDLNLPHQVGDVVEIADDHVEIMRRRIANKACRIAYTETIKVDDLGNKSVVRRPYVQGWDCLDSVVYDVNADRAGQKMPTRAFEPTAAHQPLGYWLFMVPVDERMPVGWRSSDPGRMCDMASFLTD